MLSPHSPNELLSGQELSFISRRPDHSGCPAVDSIPQYSVPCLRHKWLERTDGSGDARSKV